MGNTTEYQPASHEAGSFDNQDTYSRKNEEVEGSADFIRQAVESALKTQNWVEARDAYESTLKAIKVLESKNEADSEIIALKQEAEQYKQVAQNHIDSKQQHEEILKITQQARSMKWEESIPLWKKAQEEYQNAMLNTNIERYQQRYAVEMNEMRANEFTATSKVLEKIEKKTLTLDWEPSIKEWKTLGKKYKDALESTQDSKYINAYKKGLARIESSHQKAQGYNVLKKTKKSQTWKSSLGIYKNLIAVTNSSKVLSAEDKTQMLKDFSEALDITVANIELQKTQPELLKEENKIMTLGFRKSLPRWEKLLARYTALLDTTDIPKYQKIFSTKKTEIQQNVTIADLNGRMEDTKESNKSWASVLADYSSILTETISADIPNGEKQLLLRELKDCETVCKENKSAKELVLQSQKKVETAVADKSWNVSYYAHQEILETIHSAKINTSQLTEKRTRELLSLQHDVTTNINICMKNMSEDAETYQEQTLESVAKSHPHVAYLMTMATLKCASLQNDKQRAINTREKKVFEQPEELQEFTSNTSEGTHICNLNASDGSYTRENVVDHANSMSSQASTVIVSSEGNAILENRQDIVEETVKAISKYFIGKGEKISSKILYNQLYQMLVANKIERHDYPFIQYM